jgi:hypothetical protein
MADIHGSPGDAAQMPQAGNSGSAPVPYAGADQSPEPPDYAADLGPLGDPAASVMAGVAGLGTTESAAAHDIAAGLADAPYYPGSISPIDAAGDPDAGGRDDVAATVAGAVAAATARWHEFQADTFGQGSTYGDLMSFPPSPLDPGAGVGNTTPTGGFYDPPRGYGGQQGAPGYEGEAQ